MINNLNKHLLGCPSIKSRYCVVCGEPATNDHHVIIKGIGGSKYAKQIPTVSLCGMGNTSGCHGLAHSGRLFFDYRTSLKTGRKCWHYCKTDVPVSLFMALEFGEWRECR